jgi:hypothetical protein
MKKIVAALCGLLFATTGCSKEPPPLPGPAAIPKAAPLEIAVTQQALAPTISTATPTGDSTMYSEATVAQTAGNGLKNTHNYGGHEAFCVGAGALSTPGIRRAVLSFTLPPAPANQSVDSATLALTLIRARAAGTSLTVLADRLTSAFTEGTKAGAVSGMTEAGGLGGGPCGGGGYGVAACPACMPATAAVDPTSGFQAGSVSWINRTASAWGTAGGDFTTSGEASTTINIPTPTTAFTNQAVSLTVTQIVKDMYSTGNQSGFLLRSNNEGAAVRAVFASKQFGTPANQPALSITYKTVAGQGCSVSNDCLSGLTCVSGICCTVSTCDDSNLCTTDTCGGGGGTCLNTSAVTCSASDQCHDVGVCAPGTGICSDPVHVGSCNDGIACTHTDTCNGSGVCVGTVITCTSDPNACATLSCNGTNTCASTPRTTGTCNDSNACTHTDTCNASALCVGTGITCTSDPNACATLSCNGTNTCASTPRTTGTCNDSNACTHTDTCNASALCVGTGITCTSDPNACTTLSCNGTNTCASALRTTGTCSDGNACTHTDTCNGAGACVGTGITCTSDPNACATLSCNGTNTCASALRTTGTCNDSNACTHTDTCNGGGSCVGTGITCTSDACNTRACNGTNACAVTPLTGPSCTDGNACTQTDTCSSGSCVGSNPVVCPAPDQCHNARVCAPLTGLCSNPAKPGTPACNDALACTVGETCQAGVCTGGTATDCSASGTDDCHAGQCSEPGGCFSQPLIGNTCNDGNACTVGTTCSAGSVCNGGSALSCDDSDPCTTDSCNPGSGCVHGSAPDGTACAVDGNPCTRDTCLGGLCHAPSLAGTVCGPAASCSGTVPSAVATPAGACNGSTTTCVQVPIACGSQPCSGAACLGSCTADGQCSGTQYCDLGDGQCKTKLGTGGSCVRTAMCNALTCVDSVCCTSACAGGATDCMTCNGTSPGTCTSLALNAACNDGLFCNGTDRCNAAGACNVNTGNPCPGADGDGNCAETCDETVDSCTSPDPNGSPCNDGAFCNVGETCQAGVCTGGGARDCSVFTNQCNVGACNEGGATCQANPVTGTSCNADSSLCTNADQCLSGVCQAGAPLACGDGNSCTTDSCVAATGCAHVNLGNGIACTADSNPCTVDTCQGGLCNTAAVNGTVCGAPASCSGLIPNAAGIPAASCQGGNCTSQAPVPCGATVPCNGPACQGGCSTDVQCAVGFFCNIPLSQCQPNKAPGGSCTRDAMCLGGTTCVDTVCCTTACGGGVATDCVTCNGAGTAGACTNQTGTPCNDTLFCNGADTCNSGVCSVHAAVPPCPGPDGDGNCKESCNEATDTCDADDPAGSTCNDGLFCTVAEKCNATGVCTGGTPMDCSASGNQCNTASCDEAADTCKGTPLNGNACNDGSSCTTNDTCNAGTCTGTMSCDDGNPCTVDSCSGALTCQNVPGNAGAQCRPANGTCDDPETCNGTSPNCPADLVNGARTCSPASCTLGQATPAGVCNGASGTCPTVTAQSCGNYVCNAAACGTTCTGPNDCAQGSFCDATGHCNSKGQPGAPCTSGGQCASTFCTDGVCCNSDCSGNCEACNVAATRGVCSPVTGSPVGSRPACIGDNSGCNATCDGIEPKACAIPGNSVQCRAPSCTNGIATDPAVCDGISGKCPTVKTTPCAPSVCGATKCTGCATDAQCGTGNFCAGNGTCKPISPPGTSCTRDFECGTGHCVDSVCCDTDCTGQCESCTVPNKVGTCTAVTGRAPSGKTPCAGVSGKPCVGTCDGANRRTCTYDGFGTVCQAASCAGNRATVVAFCDGAGFCPPADQVDCASGCDGTICAGGCTGICEISTQYCSGGKCVDQKPSGTTCSNNGECSSSYCVDGVCCLESCSGQCEACNLPGTVGECTAVANAAPKGSRQPCASDGTLCGGLCNGTNRKACFYEGSSTSCRNGVCTSGIATLKGTCQDNGSCGPKQLQDCAPNACDTGGVLCANGCTADADCAGGLPEYCSGGVCVPKLPPGATCGATGQCASGHCVDGVCCDTACTRPCEACDQTNSLGKCSIVTGAPRGGRAACAGSGACGGFCDGTIATCHTPSGTTCGLSFCTGGFSADTPSCQNAVCVPARLVSCEPFACDPVGQRACLTSCSTDDDCTPGLVCNGGNCESPVSPDAGAGGAGGPGPDAGSGGTAGKAGSGGTAGKAGSGGTAGNAGATGTVDAGRGGTAGRGGATGTAGAVAQDAGPDANDGGIINGQDTGSCGCRVPGARPHQSSAPVGPLGLLAAASVLLLRRRQRVLKAAADARLHSVPS